MVSTTTEPAVEVARPVVVRVAEPVVETSAPVLDGLEDPVAGPPPFPVTTGGDRATAPLLTPVKDLVEPGGVLVQPVADLPAAGLVPGAPVDPGLRPSPREPGTIGTARSPALPAIARPNGTLAAASATVASQDLPPGAAATARDSTSAAARVMAKGATVVHDLAGLPLVGAGFAVAGVVGAGAPGAVSAGSTGSALVGLVELVAAACTGIGVLRVVSGAGRAASAMPRLPGFAPD